MFAMQYQRFGATFALQVFKCQVLGSSFVCVGY